MTYFQVLKKLLTDLKFFIGSFKFYFILGLGIIVISIGTIEPFFASKAISYLENYIKTGGIDTKNLTIFFIIWGIYIIINSLTRFFRGYYLLDVNIIRYYTNMGKKYKENLIRMSEKNFLNKKGGSIYKAFDRGIEGAVELLFVLMYSIFISCVNVLLISVIIFFVNVKMAIATLGVIPIFIILGYYFGYKTATYQEQVNEKWDVFYGKLGDYFSNLPLVKTLTFENNISKELDFIQDENEALQLPITKKWEIADLYVAFITNIARFIVIGVGVYLIFEGEIDLAILFLFFSYIGYIYAPIGFIFSQLKIVQKNLEGIKKFYEEFDNAEQDEDYEYSKEARNIKGKIEFKDVSFKYSKNSKKVLKNVNFSINPGEKIALVGSTGSGKTTISKLLLRFFDIEEGEILVDSINIKNIKKSSLRKHIGIVIQDSSLFNTTIRENMIFSKNDASDEEIIIALKKAKADFVFKSENGLDTIIGERGLKLSGGEKQRLNIARIFLRNPEILILDEATSALDNKTETEIQKSLDELLEGKTSIIIAHRLSTIKKVDKIFVIDEGVIIESGNYDELINKGGKFYELANPDKLMIS